MPKADPAKWVKSEDIAATMRFLCSNDAAAINGARVPIYGAV
jgi:NAD(P)-dependent dehydrogenase (short-subunit alcohol dehydrogenase family)